MKELTDCSVLVVDDNETNVDILVDTGYESSGEMENLVRVGSRILKLVLDHEKMIFAGDSSSGAIAALKSHERVYGRKLLAQFLPMIEKEASKGPIQKLRVGELAPGMVIHQDILTKEGKLLVKAGTEVSLPVYETLHNFSRTGFIKETVQVLVPEPI